MKPKKQDKYKDILFILISSFIVVVLWIGFNLYHIWVTSTISEDIQVKLTPIDGTFDTETLEKLKNRAKVKPAFEREAVASPTALPTVFDEPSPPTSIESQVESTKTPSTDSQR